MLEANKVRSCHSSRWMFVVVYVLTRDGIVPPICCFSVCNEVSTALCSWRIVLLYSVDSTASHAQAITSLVFAVQHLERPQK